MRIAGRPSIDTRARESDLYAPVRDYLLGQGYEVKAEVEHCDVVARRPGEPPVVVELKRHLNLELILQAVDRLKVTDAVYVAFPRSAPLWRRRWSKVRDLARRLGVGLLTVSNGRVEARLDPTPYRPRGSERRRRRLLLEFEQRVGDPNVGGTTGVPRTTAYRQDALRCAAALGALSPQRTAELRRSSGVPKAATICQRDVYGWFERVERGTYALSPHGRKALLAYADVVAALRGPSSARRSAPARATSAERP